ncbi:class I SAM-dependent methyltransferase [Amycolatopsis cynarae]|uniref:Class I SAM-dependent methyltransferase n=1 Tax=Amycolatopsis cynarae TaxID=2995223 RepID=A0ABY7AYR7_9PSEU|nr:class I SAM-dependent methyltransferase [Amycolatopsis sp. HUAS 11-8]WAL64087.1 class I SAM-dependent methyltransferase [Amycolatopsis sp. HUAS 11-8]
MPFNHNDHYHPLLLRQVPARARTALDVGCGTGKFTRKLAATGLAVEGIDPAREAIEAACATSPGKITYRCEDVTRAGLPEGHYDFISCLAALHHMPFETVTKLRRALAPGGVLAVLGLALPSSARDLGKWLLAAPLLNVPARLVVAAGDRLNGGGDHVAVAPVRDPDLSMAEVRRGSATLLPGSTVRTLLFWRYLLVYRAG